VLYKSPSDSSLYTLVSDSVFLHESSIVWERLEDVDGGWSAFVDGDFVESHPVGGDFAGETAESTLRAFEAATGQFSVVDPAEFVSINFEHLRNRADL
jgi:ubiquitin carboxyl-terminal hydrolase MINDY-1/2